MCKHCHEIKDTKKKKKYLIEYKELMEEYDKEANKGLDPSKLTYGSGKKVWWICPLGHKYECKIFNRTTKHYGCPYCSGRKVLTGFNDLASRFPELMEQFDLEANKGIDPTKLTYGSGVKVWWICPNGHKWQTKICSRTTVGTGCPYCSRFSSSLPEFAIKYYLDKLNFNVIHSFRDFGFEIDIFIPELNIGIEYDGYYWHKNRFEKDIEKNKKCKKLGITLYRIREGLDSLNSSSIDIIYDFKKESLSEPIKKLVNYICPDNNLCINCDKDKRYIYEIRDISRRSKVKYMKINNVTMSYEELSIYLGYNPAYVNFLIHKIGFKKAVKCLTKMYEEKQERGYCSKHHIRCFDKNFELDKYIEINGIIKGYKEWSSYFNRGHNFVTNMIGRHGLKKTIERLTEMYKEKNEKGFCIKNPHTKYITIDNVRKSYRGWSKYFNKTEHYVSALVSRCGLKGAIKRLTQLYYEKQNRNHTLNDCRSKYIEINNIVKNYREWSAYFGKYEKFVQRKVEYYGLKKAIEYLTKLYWEKQKQESTQKDNNAG